MKSDLVRILVLGTAVLSFTLFVQGCKKKDQILDIEEEVEIEGSALPEVGEVTDDAFKLEVLPFEEKDDVPELYHLHKMGSYNEGCEITDHGEYIDCVLEVDELAVQYHGANLLYNVPKAMCDYFTKRMSYYWNRLGGYGPKTFVYTKNVEGIVISSTVDGNASVPYGSFDDNTTTGNCAYDYTGIEGPNCCVGEYQIIGYQQVEDEDGNVSTIQLPTIESDWGGELSNCLAGVAMHNAPKSESGWPMWEISDTEDTGTNGEEKMVGPIQMLSGGSSYNTHVANYYEPGPEHYHEVTIDSLGITLSSDAPHAIDPIADLGENLLPSGQGAHVFRCLDSADEVMAEIRLWVREWNEKSELELYHSSEGTLGNPDTVGSEPLNPFFTLNDYIDWFDIGSFVSGEVISDLDDPGFSMSELLSQFPQHKQP